MSRSSTLLGAKWIRRHQRMAILSSVASLAFISSAAQADCTANGLTVTCTGTSTGYSNVTSGISLSADSTAKITGQVLLGNTATVTNAGSMTSSTTAPVLQVGSSSSVVNNGTISLTNASSGAAAVLLGDNSTFTNNGTVTAPSGVPVLQFGQAGTFINNTSATAAVTGNIIFGPNVSGGTSTLNNYNTAFGITGNIFSTGNTVIYNKGLFSGGFVETPTGGNVTITNDTGGTFAGSISTGDTTTLVNNGTMSLTGTTTLGSAHLGVSSLTNSGTLNVGTTGTTELVVNGSFVNAPSGVLNIALHSNGASAPAAGTSFSQVYAAGASGTATLGGTLNIMPTPGFYQSGSTYNIILADQSITGSFTTINGATLPFISFVPVGIVTVGTQQAYQLMAVRSTTYANAIASVATPTQLAIAQALEPLVTAANADPTSAAAGLVGDLDLLTVPQMQTLLDQINPAGYVTYTQAMLDQINLFNRQVMLRTLDPTNPDMPSGWWGDVSGQFNIGSTAADKTSENLFGVTAGYDISSSHFTVGLAAGFSSASLKNGSKALTGHNNAYMFGAYGAYRAGPLVATAQLDYDLGSLSTKKTLSLSYTTTTAATPTTPATVTPNNIVVTATPGDHLLRASGSLGVNLDTGFVKVMPFAGVDYARGSINGFTEAGGEAVDLTVSRLNIDRTDLLAGLNVSKSDGVFRPYVRAAYRSQIGGNSTPAVTAFFNGDPTTTFTVDGTELSRREVDVDAGINIVYDDGSYFLGYQGTIRKDMSDHGIQAGIRIRF
jgi:uncharacterized protein with beta-barrel porin domain